MQKLEEPISMNLGELSGEFSQIMELIKEILEILDGLNFTDESL